jgi:hypothetical protein
VETQAIGACAPPKSVTSPSFSPPASGNLNVASMKNVATCPGSALPLALEDGSTRRGMVNGGTQKVVISVASVRESDFVLWCFETT